MTTAFPTITLFRDDQPRGNDGKWVGGSGGVASSAPARDLTRPAGSPAFASVAEAARNFVAAGKAPLAWVAKSLGWAKRMGGAAEHAVMHAATSVLPRAAANVANPELRALATGAVGAAAFGTKAYFVTWRTGQAAVERVAAATGMPPDKAAELRSRLTGWDVALCKPVFSGFEVAGLKHAALGSSFVPLASAGYLAWATARHPVAVAKAAAGAVRDAVWAAPGVARDIAGKAGAATRAAAGVLASRDAGGADALPDPNPTPAEIANVRLIAEHWRRAGYSDWWWALLHHAAVGTGGGAAAVALADAACKRQSDPPAGPDALDAAGASPSRAELARRDAGQRLRLGRWVTLEDDTHVYIKNSGVIEKGPARLTGKKVGQLPPPPWAGKDKGKSAGKSSGKSAAGTKGKSAAKPPPAKPAVKAAPAKPEAKPAATEKPVAKASPTHLATPADAKAWLARTDTAAHALVEKIAAAGESVEGLLHGANWKARSAGYATANSALRADNPQAVASKVESAMPDEIKPHAERWFGQNSGFGTHAAAGGAQVNAAAATQAADWVSQHVEGRPGVTNRVSFVPAPVPRESCVIDPRDRSASVVFATGKTTQATYVHELGHSLENSLPGLKAAASSFLKYRTEGEKPALLNDVAPPGSKGNYGPNEVGMKDDFGKAFDGAQAYYVGKVYNSGDTEIVSMGLEKMYKDPVGFCQKDPEYAKFITGVMTGEIGSHGKGGSGGGPPSQVEDHSVLDLPFSPPHEKK